MRRGITVLHADRITKEKGNEKDPSAGLGMTKRGKAYLTFLFNR